MRYALTIVEEMLDFYKMYLAKGLEEDVKKKALTLKERFPEAEDSLKPSLLKLFNQLETFYSNRGEPPSQEDAEDIIKELKGHRTRLQEGLGQHF